MINLMIIYDVVNTMASIHKTCWDQILSQVLSFGLKSETIFGLKLVSYSQNRWDQI